MTEQEFLKFCGETPAGTPLSFDTGKTHGTARFIGCTPNSVVIEARGETYTLPRDLVQFEKASYPIPSYS